MYRLAFVTFLIAATANAVPLASKITASAPNAELQTTITGAAGAVEPNAGVVLFTLDTGHYATTRAGADGSFSATLFAPRGSSVMVKSDPGLEWFNRIANGPPIIEFHVSDLTSLHGTVVRVDVPPASSGVAFAGAGVAREADLAVWVIEGTLARQQFVPGEVVEARGAYTLLAKSLATANDPRVEVRLSLELLSDADGHPMTTWSYFDSALTTATGLPIERIIGPPGGLAVNLPLVKGGANFVVVTTVPADLRPGYYLPRIWLQTRNVPQERDNTVRMTTFIGGLRGPTNSMALPVIRVGSPAAPRIPAVLMMNDLSEGARGAVAVEDRGRFALSNHIVTTADVLVVPPRTYNLDPFVPTLGVSDRGGPPDEPLLPLRFPAGSLTVTIRAPSGTVRTLGPSPLRQWAMVGPTAQNGQILEGGPYITDALQLRTLDPAFDVAFAEEGRHVVTLTGSVEDLWGNAWSLGGTYEIEVARPLIIDSAIVPGTPFETGNALALHAQLIPPVAADVEVRVRHAPAGKPVTDVRLTGRSNRFGWLTLAAPLLLQEPGEYRIDFFARHRDAAGRVWAGTRTWGGVVASPQASLIAHGKRGIDDQQTERQQWFFRTQTGSDVGRGHVHLPFHGGDVMWMQKSDSTIPIITFQDPGGATAATLRQLSNAVNPPIQGPFDARATIGEIPLLSGNRSGREVHLAPDQVEGWGYFYASVQRPLVRVREIVAEEGGSLAYWRFGDRYGMQSGTGWRGDLENDFKFQFGGVVLRGPLFDPPQYAIYGSLFVLVPEEGDPEGGTRVFPPFRPRGAGGPLFTLKGKSIDMFFHPTAVRAGTILHTGQTAAFAGYSAPTLPSRVEIAVTSPSGITRTVAGRANKIGWFRDPADDLSALEPGVWKAKAKIVFDGSTSDGPVSEPFPTGGILGTSDGEVRFYVVDSDTPQLELAPSPTHVRPADGPITFTVLPPAELTNVELHYTATMPGFVLEQGTAASMQYVYDAPRLAADFPNLDLHGGYGTSGADTITISLLLSGTDAGGTRKHLARQIVIQGEELLMPDQPPTPKRRSVR